MGMFDYVFVEEETSLPELPHALIGEWGGNKSAITFQTKCTPSQCMSKYVIGGDGVLYEQNYDATFVEDDSILGFSQIRENVRLEPTTFSGTINFYNSVRHPKYNFDKNEYFEDGWIEYVAFFKKGVLDGEIEVFSCEEPVELSEEQLAEKQKAAEKSREETKNYYFEQRKKYPTVEQKLIDNIAREVKLATSIPTMEDYGRALNNIELFIAEYREKHDPFFK